MVCHPLTTKIYWRNTFCLPNDQKRDLSWEKVTKDATDSRTWHFAKGLHTHLTSWLFIPPQGPVSRKSRELFGHEKPFLKLPPAYSVKPVFWYVVKGILFKITAKFRASRRLCFEDTKRNMSPKIRPKSFGTFEKRAPDLVTTTPVTNPQAQPQ